jgi:hypothetical protein
VLPGEHIYATLEALLDPARDRERACAADREGGLRWVQPRRQLEQRERVTVRLCDDPVSHPVVEPFFGRGCQERSGILVRESAHHQAGDAGQLAGDLARRE